MVFLYKVSLFLFIGTCMLPKVSNQRNSKNNSTLFRRKRQIEVDDDKWYWGYAIVNAPLPILNTYQTSGVVQKKASTVAQRLESTSSTTIRATIPTTTPTTESPIGINEDVDPCNRSLIERPDFNDRGERISLQKCNDYIWNVHYRSDIERRSNECNQYWINRIRQNKIKMNGEVSFGGAIGGYTADPGEFPHMAAIGWQAAVGTWIFKCGGTLISEKFVLTAAHCTKASPVDTTIADDVPKIVRLGSVNVIDKPNFNYGINGKPADKNITNIIVHPKYKSPKKYFDIALLKLQNNVEFSRFVQPACMWNRFDHNIKWAKATGWGVVESGSRTTSPDLQVVELDMIDSETCDTLLRPNCNRNWCGIQDSQICAGILAGGVDACQGDSGGPLQSKLLLKDADSSMYIIVGITSFGFSCALPNTPGVYTRVSHFLDWIESIVWP